MKFFINDTPVKISELDSKVISKSYDRIMEGEIDIIPDHFTGEVLLKFPKNQQVVTIVRLLQAKKILHLTQLTIVVSNKKFVEGMIKKQFRSIKAAGGVVIKDGKFLMIFRLGFWDLPKGKFDSGETSQMCAVREVQEECGVIVKITDTITSTWHSYVTKNGNNYLKKTDWFLMDCVDDTKIKPQIEEGIDQIQWIGDDELNLKLEQSYNSIKHVFRKLKKVKLDN